MKPAVIVFLKAPRVGQVKTRLARSTGAPEATRIYRSLAEAQFGRIPASWHIEVLFTPADAEAEMKAWLGGGLDYRPQSSGGLGERLVAGFAEMFAAGHSPVIAIGGDCPELDEACLNTARAALTEHDVVLGPATDGGYYLIGLNQPAPELFTNIPWSTTDTLAATQRRIAENGLRCGLLEPKADIDDAESWAQHLAKQRANADGALTVIVPALNEAGQIQPTLRSIRSILPAARLLVVDGGSSDATVALTKSEGADVIFANRGRGIQLAAGAAAARTEWLLFLHADTRLPNNAQRVIAEFMHRATKSPPRAEAGIESRKFGHKMARNIAKKFIPNFLVPSRAFSWQPVWRLRFFAASHEFDLQQCNARAPIATFRLRFDRAGWFLRTCCWFTRFDSVFTRFGDQGILVRADFYHALGGFPAWPLFEDVALLQRARRHTRVWSLPAAVTTSARRFERRGHLSQQWLNARLLIRYLLGTPPERLAEIYRASAQTHHGARPNPLPILNEAERSER